MARIVGWVGVALALLAVSTLVVLRALAAGSPDSFTTWVGWANVFALPVGAIGVAIVIVDRLRQRAHEDPTSPDASLDTRDTDRPWMAPTVEDAVVRADLSARLTDILHEPDGRAVGITGIHGAGGFGKTTLVGQVAASPDLHRRFEGGLLWVTVGEATRGPAIAQAVNDLVEQLTGSRPSLSTPEQAGYRLGAELDRRKAVLLVLDDVWTPEQLRPFLSGGAHCTRLVTTRVPGLLPDGAVLVEVDEMSRQEAVDLLEQRIPRIPAAQVTRVLELTGRWPLLIRLVNGLLRRRTGQGEEVSDAVAAVVERLTADGPAALDLSVFAQRERAVELTVRAGFDILPDGSEDRFYELGIFPEDVVIPEHIIELLWAGTAGATARDTVRTRDALLEVSLVRRSHSGITIHDVLRSYLRRQVGDAALAVMNESFVDAARTLLPREPPADDGYSRWWMLPLAEGYLWRHLCGHLADAGLVDELVSTATELRFVSVKLQAHGVAEVESDLDLLPKGTALSLRTRLSQNAHVLAPIQPVWSFRDLLVSRLHGIAELEEELESYGAEDARRDRLVARWPLPDLAPASLVRVIVGGNGWLGPCAIDPRGHWVAAGTRTGLIGLWELSTGRVLGQLPGHQSPISAIAVSTDGAWIVAGAEDGAVAVFDAARRRRSHELPGHDAEVRDCSVSPDATRAATASADGTVIVSDIATGEVRYRQNSDNEVLGCGFVADDRVLTLLMNGDLVEHQIHEGTSQILLSDPSVIAGMAIGAGGRWVVASGVDDELRVYRLGGSLADTAPTIMMQDNASSITAFLGVGNLLVTGAMDGTVRFWDIEAEKQLGSLRAHTSWVNDVALTADERHLITVGTDGTIRIWDAHAARRENVSGHVDWVHCCAVSPDGREVASGGSDGTLRIWDAENGNETGRWTAGRTVWSCAYGQRREPVAAAGDGWTVSRSGAETRGTVLLVDDRGSIDLVAVADDAPRFAFCGSSTHEISIRVSEDIESTVNLTHDERIEAIGFTSGATLLISDNTGAVLRWKPDRSELQLVTRCPEPVIAFGALDSGSQTVLLLTWSHVYHLDLATTAITNEHELPGGVADGAITSDSRWLAVVDSHGQITVYELATMRLAASLRVDGGLFACAWRPGKWDLYVAGRQGLYAFTLESAEIERERRAE